MSKFSLKNILPAENTIIARARMQSIAYNIEGALQGEFKVEITSREHGFFKYKICFEMLKQDGTTSPLLNLFVEPDDKHNLATVQRLPKHLFDVGYKTLSNNLDLIVKKEGLAYFK